MLLKKIWQPLVITKKGNKNGTFVFISKTCDFPLSLWTLLSTYPERMLGSPYVKWKIFWVTLYPITKCCNDSVILWRPGFYKINDMNDSPLRSWTSGFHFLAAKWMKNECGSTFIPSSQAPLFISANSLPIKEFFFLFWEITHLLFVHTSFLWWVKNHSF